MRSIKKVVEGEGLLRMQPSLPTSVISCSTDDPRDPPPSIITLLSESGLDPDLL